MTKLSPFLNPSRPLSLKMLS
ncbi:hypothetical protein GQ600_3608 [Phytophthora cactorum]|nr:hypothetical protein GQ600_3608 [Phytophthora cactorum]